MPIVSGIVKNWDGELMPWVGVIIDPDKPKDREVTITNKKGQFAFESQTGDHILAVRSPFLRPFTKKFTLQQTGKKFNIQLESTLRMLDYPVT